MTTTLRVYTKVTALCVQCDLTLDVARGLGDAIELEVYEGIDLPENETLLAAFKNEGLAAAPIVTVHDDEGNRVDAWAGFQPLKIKALS